MLDAVTLTDREPGPIVIGTELLHAAPGEPGQTSGLRSWPPIRTRGWRSRRQTCPFPNASPEAREARRQTAQTVQFTVDFRQHYPNIR